MYNSKEKSLFCAQLALDKKAYDVIVLELKELTSFKRAANSNFAKNK